MRIGSFSVWTSEAEALEVGATHHARIFGVIPGFCSEGEAPIWISRSDLLNPIEDVVRFLWAVVQAVHGEEPSFMFQVRRPIRQ
jgi:hypothetical protein